MLAFMAFTMPLEQVVLRCPQGADFCMAWSAVSGVAQADMAGFHDPGEVVER